MKERVVNFLRVSFPFLLTLVLWRLSNAFWNPGGILCLIPIFFCTFVRPMPGFGLFGVFMCFLLDYKFDSLLYWTAVYCFCYALNGFQSVIDLSRRDKNGIDAFSVFLAINIFILFVMRAGWHNLVCALWMLVLAIALYLPVTVMIERTTHD